MGHYQVERLFGGYPGLECPSIGAREDIGGADWHRSNLLPNTVDLAGGSVEEGDFAD